MLSPITGRRRKHKSFNYKPRYYDPEQDERKKKMQRIRIESKVRRGQGRSVLLIAALLFIIFYIFINL